VALAEGNDDLDRIDETHAEWSEWVTDTAHRVDSFFSNEQADETAQKTRLRAFVRFRYDDNKGVKVSPGIRAKISLPGLENRVQLMLGDDEDETRVDDIDNQQQNISLQFKPRADRPWQRLRYGIGISRRDSKYQPYGRIRHSKTLLTKSPWVPQVSNSFYYFTKSKFEYRGEASFDRTLSSHLFFRPTSVLRWYEKNPDQCDGGWCFDQYFSLYEKLRRSKSEVIAYDAEIYLRDKPQFTLHDAVFKARYRRMTSKEWLFWEIEPAIHFPDEYDHEPTFRLTFRIEGIFGHNDRVDINQDFIPVESLWENENP
jgi:hypothetical protein